MPSTMAPTKAIARYAVIRLSLPENVMSSLPLLPPSRESIMVNRKSLSEKVRVAAAHAGLRTRVCAAVWLKNTEINALKSL